MLRLLRRKKPVSEAAGAAASDEEKALTPNFWTRVLSRYIGEPYAGAWQLNDELTADDGLSYPVVFACVTRIADDISKVPLRVERRDSNGIYQIDRNNEFTRLLKRPNDYQDRQKFLAQWEASIQSRGNAYIFMGRDAGAVTSLHVLNPDLVMPLVTPSGGVYYQLQQDNITGIKDERIVPASEIIHDRINCLFHPLVGLSPLYAAALNVWLGKKSLEQQQQLFANGATPGGVLIFPGNLKEETAKRIQDTWNSQYSGDNAGKTAVLGDGVTYQRLGIPAEDAQLIEQLRFGALLICSVFHVPPYKVGVGDMPSVADIEGLNQIYFSDCIQSRMTAIQNALNAAFDLESTERSFRFELDSLILMDTKTRAEIATNLRKGGLTKIDESRRRMNYGPIEGGDDIYMQQQDHSLRAIFERDRRYLDGETQTPEVEPVPEVAPEPVPQGLSDGQLSYVREVVSMVASGTMEKGAAKTMILLSQPALDEDKISRMIDSIKTKSFDLDQMKKSFSRGLGNG